MALNTIIFPYNKISEVEECKPVSSPSSTSFGEYKTAPYIYTLNSPLLKNYNLPIKISNKKNKSTPPSLNSHDIHDLFFGENKEHNISLYTNNLNTEKEKYNNLNNIDENYGKRIFQIKTLHFNKNPFRNDDSFDENESENNKNVFPYHNATNNLREFDIINKNKLYNRIKDNYKKKPKIKPVQEDE